MATRASLLRSDEVRERQQRCAHDHEHDPAPSQARVSTPGGVDGFADRLLKPSFELEESGLPLRPLLGETRLEAVETLAGTRRLFDQEGELLLVSRARLEPRYSGYVAAEAGVNAARLRRVDDGAAQELAQAQGEVLASRPEPRPALDMPDRGSTHRVERIDETSDEYRVYVGAWYAGHGLRDNVPEYPFPSIDVELERLKRDYVQAGGRETDANAWAQGASYDSHTTWLRSEIRRLRSRGSSEEG